MKSLKEKIINNKFFCLVFITVIAITIMPLMQRSIPVADDFEFHFARIQSIADSLKLGTFPVKVHPSMANSYGYGTGLFYPNLILYIPALLVLLTQDLVLSYSLFIFILLIFTYILTYYSIKAVTKDSKLALLGTVLIMFSRNLAFNLYDRTALGELLGFIFMIPVICGMYNYVHDEFDKPWLLFIGFLGAIYSHLISTLICIVYAIIYFIINIKSSINNPKKILKLMLVALLVVIISSAFWIPMLEQMGPQKFNFSEPWTNISNESYCLYDLLGTGRFGVGLIITLCTPLLIYAAFDKSVDKKYKFFIVLTLIIMLLMILHPFWIITNSFMNTIQFKWRLLGIVTILYVISMTYLVPKYSEELNFNLNMVTSFIIILAFGIATVQITNIVESHDHRMNEEIMPSLFVSEFSIGGGQEYLPTEVHFSDLQYPNFAKTDKDKLIPVEKSGLNAKMTIEQNDVKTVEVPFIYYYGYVANITTDDGNVIPLNVNKSDNGLVELSIPDGATGTIQTWYNGTKLQKISLIISVITTVLTVVYIIIKKIKMKASK